MALALLIGFCSANLGSGTRQEFRAEPGVPESLDDFRYGGNSHSYLQPSTRLPLFWAGRVQWLGSLGRKGTADL